ncbi:MAG: TRAP transporter large permease subunit [Ruminococcaceae bacterium]|nr:TRAP transporter large permease subunit [Oscillospiraceae bacterium]
MPIEVLFIVALLAIICVAFLLFKRPIYECMLYGYILMVILTGEYKNFFTYIGKTSTDTLFYSIIAFLVLAKILDATHAIDSVVNVIISVFGRFRGGAAYTAVIGSTFMGALSGSGAGNVATTGVFTIPAMKKSGVPAHLAANIESASSTMGNMIPPSGVILTALACYNEFSGSEMSQSAFWIACWGVAIWFIIQRILTVFVFCRYYKVKPMAKEEIPSLKKTLKEGWKNLLLPVIILAPFVLDYLFKTTLFAERLGDGASNFSSCLLLFTPGIAAVYALIVNRKKCKEKLTETIKKSVSGIVPVGATIFFAYCISNLFAATNIGVAIGEYIQSWNLSVVALAFIVPLITAILGMVFPGSAQTKIFGTTIIAIFAAAGANPLLVAVMLPVITGAMEGMTPPLALCMYTAMGIAESKFKETTLNCLIWVGIHYLLAVLCLLGILPILGI